MTTRNSHRRTKSFFSLKTKIALLCTCSIIIAVFVNFTYLINVCVDAITSSTKITMQDLATSYSNNLSDAIRQVSESANFMMSSTAISAFVNSEGTENAAEVEELITMYLGTNTSNEDISLVNAKGVVLFSTNSSLIGTDLSDQTYFTKMVDTGLSSQGNVFTSKSSGEACTTFAIPLRTDMQVVGMMMPGMTVVGGSSPTSDTSTTDGTQIAMPDGVATQGIGNQQIPVEEFTGAIVTSVKVSKFSSIVSDINIGDYETGYAFIVDSSGTYVYHPDETLIGTKADISEINDTVTTVLSVTEPTSNTITFTDSGVTKYAGYSVNEDNQWILFIAADQVEVLSSLKAVSKDSISVIILLTAVLTIIAYLIAGRITNPIKGITKLIHKTAELDFTEDDSYLALTTRRDETGEMSRAIQQMRTVLNDMVQHINEVSGKINASSDNLSIISNSVNDHASDNSATAEELSASMQETAATTEQIYTAIEQIGNSSKEINNKVTLGAELSKEIINRADQLKTATNSSTAIAKKVYEEVKLRTDAALEQSKAVHKISVLTKTIKEIASQTNLLALNASIEAARAGDAGSGFSVVASEIGILAQQSSKTVQGITTIVDEVYLAVENMAKSLEQTLTFMEKNVLVDYDDFLTNSEKYNSDAKVMNHTMESIHNQIDFLNTNLLGISDAIAEINMMVSEASKGVNDVAEKNTNIVALTTSTQSMTKENTDYASSLKEIVDKFKLQ